MMMMVVVVVVVVVGLAMFMAVQWVSGAIRFMSGTGVWRKLKEDNTNGSKT